MRDEEITRLLRLIDQRDNLDAEITFLKESRDKGTELLVARKVQKVFGGGDVTVGVFELSCDDFDVLINSKSNLLFAIKREIELL